MPHRENTLEAETTTADLANGDGDGNSPPPSPERRVRRRGLGWAGRLEVLILVGPPGSGKSTFAEAVLNGAATASGRPWVRVCQVGRTPGRAPLSLPATLLNGRAPL